MRGRVSRRVAALGCGLLLAGLLGGSDTLAAEDERTWGYALAHELMSPFCPGRTLAACTSGQADELRQWILLQEAAGASREEVIETLYQRYGEMIRSTPEAKGWGLAAYVVPIFALLAGGAVVAFGLRRMVGRAGALPSGASLAASPAASVALDAASDAELERLLEQEMRDAEA